MYWVDRKFRTNFENVNCLCIGYVFLSFCRITCKYFSESRVILDQCFNLTLISDEDYLVLSIFKFGITRFKPSKPLPYIFFGYSTCAINNAYIFYRLFGTFVFLVKEKPQMLIMYCVWFHIPRRIQLTKINVFVF